MPEPKLVIAMGACSIFGGVFADCAEVDRRFLETFKPALDIPVARRIRSFSLRR